MKPEHLHFLNKIKGELSKDLPGFEAQRRMAPLGRKSPLDYKQEGIEPRNSAVLVLLFPDQSDHSIRTVLIQRPEDEPGNHAGQISFPGGGYHEKDIELSATAIREAQEEIGVDAESIQMLGALSQLYIPVSNYLVHPYVAWSAIEPAWHPDPREVSGIIRCNLLDLVAESSKGEVSRYLKIRNYESVVPCYKIEGKIVWGATAMILAELEDLVRKIT